MFLSHLTTKAKNSEKRHFCNNTLLISILLIGNTFQSFLIPIISQHIWFCIHHPYWGHEETGLVQWLHLVATLRNCLTALRLATEVGNGICFNSCLPFLDHEESMANWTWTSPETERGHFCLFPRKKRESPYCGLRARYIGKVWEYLRGKRGKQL